MYRHRLLGTLLCAILITTGAIAQANPAVFLGYFGERQPVNWQVRPADATLEALLTDLLTQTDQTANFRTQAANVATAAVSIRNGQRYLLYNATYLNSLEADVLRIAILAHLAGHHLLQHTLAPERAEAEDLEAGAYAGYALYHIGAQAGVLTLLPELLSRPGPLSVTEQQAALERGYRRAEAALLLAPYAGFNEDETGDALAGIPEFPLPHPLASASADLTDYFIHQGTFGQVAKQLEGLLDQSGYYEKSYRRARGGFALITQLEQFRPDGSSMNEPARWSARPVRSEDFSWLDYIKALFTADDGYFRVFVFVVTPEYRAPTSDRRVSRREADTWLAQGLNRLPAVIAEQALPAQTTVTALVYEFRVPETDREKTDLSRPSALSGRTHVTRARLWPTN